MKIAAECRYFLHWIKSVFWRIITGYVHRTCKRFALCFLLFISNKSINYLFFSLTILKKTNPVHTIQLFLRHFSVINQNVIFPFPCHWRLKSEKKLLQLLHTIKRFEILSVSIKFCMRPVNIEFVTNVAQNIKKLNKKHIFLPFKTIQTQNRN